MPVVPSDVPQRTSADPPCGPGAAPDAAASPNAALAADLAELAALLRLARVDRFRVRAYERAARLALACPVDLATLDPEALRRLEGIGAGLAGVLAERAQHGRISRLEELRAEHPAGLGALLGLPLVGVRDARALSAAGLQSIDAVREAAGREGALDDLDERLAGRLRESLRRLPEALDPRRPAAQLRRDAEALRRALRGALAEVEDAPPADVVVAGAVRRGADRIGDLDLVVVTPLPLEVVRAAVLDSPAVVRALDGRGSATPPVATSRMGSPALAVLSAPGLPARLHVAPPDRAGAALLHATGTPAHVEDLARRATERGLQLRHLAGATEEEIYAALGLQPVPPELREGASEVAHAADGTLPALVRTGDLRGDLHVHSDFSGDGVDSVEEMVRGCAGRGYDYVAITDHAENLSINGMPREIVEHRRTTIAEVQRRHPHLRVLDGAELNIDLAGALDYDLDLLLRFDLCVASVHSHMDRGAAEQTERILAAIAHPAVHVIGHPTGRIIGRRPGYPIDLRAIAEAAAETGTALEVNGSPARLDLDGPMIRAALEAGATLSLSSDAHSLGELRNAEHAVTTARRGWAAAADVLNARGLEGLLAFTAAKRARG
jgi:DNA polymerase (family X)